MKKIISVFLSALLFTCLPVIHAAESLPRAIWIWEEEAYDMLDDEKQLVKVEDFLEQYNINIMYLYADKYHNRNIVQNEPEKYRKLIAHAHARGFKVYALLGSYYLDTPKYILPEKRNIALKMFTTILDFNKHADKESQFDGINIDIEPYLLDDWRPSRKLRGKQYLELSKAFMDLKAASGLDLQVGPAIPFWFSGITDVTWNERNRNFNKWIQDIYDYVALMDYRNEALGSDSMTSLAAEELAYGDRVNKKVMIGVETLNTQPRKVTFYGKGIKYLDKQLALAQSEMSKHPSFGGFVIHNLESYQKMVNKNK